MPAWRTILRSRRPAGHVVTATDDRGRWLTFLVRPEDRAASLSLLDPNPVPPSGTRATSCHDAIADHRRLAEQCGPDHDPAPRSPIGSRA